MIKQHWLCLLSDGSIQPKSAATIAAGCLFACLDHTTFAVVCVLRVNPSVAACEALVFYLASSILDSLPRNDASISSRFPLVLRPAPLWKNEEAFKGK